MVGVILKEAPATTQNKTQSAILKTWRGGVFLKSHIFALVAGAFYKRFESFMLYFLDFFISFERTAAKVLAFYWDCLLSDIFVYPIMFEGPLKNSCIHWSVLHTSFTSTDIYRKGFPTLGYQVGKTS